MVVRSASIATTAEITAIGEILGAHLRSASLNATGAIASSPQRVLQRSAQIAAAGLVASAPQRALQRQVALNALAQIASAGATAGLHQAAVELAAVAGIATTGQSRRCSSGRFYSTRWR